MLTCFDFPIGWYNHEHDSLRGLGGLVQLSGVLQPYLLSIVRRVAYISVSFVRPAHCDDRSTAVHGRFQQSA
jgi:hypothetical protein